MATTDSTLETWYKFLLAQMSAESYLDQRDIGVALQTILRNGNNNGIVQAEGDFTGATRMTTTQVEQFNAEWEILDHHANDGTGFSATLLRSRTTGELTLSFRSTEYQSENKGGDWSRDGFAGADGQIFFTGFAVAQLTAMEEYWSQLQQNPLLVPAGAKINVTGYSLGAHLATVFTELHAEQIDHTYTFNAAGRGTVTSGAEGTQQQRIAAMLARFKEAMLHVSSIDGGPAARSPRSVGKPRRYNLQNPTQVNLLYAAAA